jgi:predicted lipoprotein with Yx(FWY)xxD motif
MAYATPSARREPPPIRQPLLLVAGTAQARMKIGHTMHVLKHRAVAVVGAVTAVGLGAAACGTSYGTTHAAAPGASTTSAIRTQAVTVDGKVTTILTDGNGLPLYYYAPDTATRSLVTGGLAGLWPPVTSSTTPAAAGLHGTVSLLHDSHGSQVAYNGHLLYTFVSDRSGKVTGQGVERFFVATPSLAPISAASSSGTTSGTGMYGGY